MKKEAEEKQFTTIHNMPVPLYGPPKIALKETKKESEEQTFSVEVNIHPCVYGPPPDSTVRKLKRDSKNVGKGGIMSQIRSKLKIRKGTSDDE